VVPTHTQKKRRSGYARLLHSGLIVKPHSSPTGARVPWLVKPVDLGIPSLRSVVTSVDLIKLTV